MQNLLAQCDIAEELKMISEKILGNQRISIEEGALLFRKGELGFLGILASHVCQKRNNNLVCYNTNYHIEPTNICVNKCKFCSYRRDSGDAESWKLSIDEIVDIVRQNKNGGFTEVHIVGGVHPEFDLNYYKKLFSSIINVDTSIHIKALSAVEIDYLAKKSSLSIKEVLNELKQYGLKSIPGGGAEIFDVELRKEICSDKATTQEWLHVHQTAHELGIPSNATMLYGHVETYEQRINHLNILRELQDKTLGFNAFIPLKFKNKNNDMSGISEINLLEDLRNYAVSRIFLDNFNHIKAYWPMMGKEASQLALSFGVDDIDGTIENTTKIYSMAGVSENAPKMTVAEIRELITKAGKKPVERDSLYNIITT